jgi:hypothetical protein
LDARGSAAAGRKLTLDWVLRKEKLPAKKKGRDQSPALKSKDELV